MDASTPAAPRDADVTDSDVVRRRTRLPIPWLLGFIPHLMLLAGVVTLSFLSGGYIFVRATPAVLALLGLAVAWVWIAPKHLAPGRLYGFGLLLFAAFALWTGASLFWSIGPDLTWRAFDYALLFLLAAVIAGTAPCDRAHLRVVGYGYVAVMVPVAVWALLGKVLPDVVEHAHTYSRLSQPIGYWNALAIILVMALPLAIEGASRRDMPVAVRGVFAASSTLFLFTLVFTFSRGGTLALIAALIVYFALANERLAGVVSAVVVATPVAFSLYRLRDLSSLYSATTDDALRSAQGHAMGRWVLASLVAVFAVQFGTALVHRRLHPSRRLVLVTGTVVLALAVIAGASGAKLYADRYGGPVGFVRSSWDQLTGTTAVGGDTGDSVSRLLSISNNGRIMAVRIGVRQWRLHPVAGTGAGTFRFTNLLFRPSAGFIVKHAHNQWINVLSELGLVGLALFAAAVVAMLVAAFRRVLRDRADRDRGLLAAMQAGMIAYVLHLTVDWDWDLAATTVAFLLLTGVAAAYLRGSGLAAAAAETPAARSSEQAPRDDDATLLASAADAGPATRRSDRRARTSGWAFGPAGRVLATGVIGLAAVSWLVPYLADKASARAIAFAADDRVADAMAQARSASRLDPLAADPLITLALLQQRDGKAREALETLRMAQRLQPQNSRVYYQLGMLQMNVFGLNQEAAKSFRTALALNPHDELSAYELSRAEQVR